MQAFAQHPVDTLIFSEGGNENIDHQFPVFPFGVFHLTPNVNSDNGSIVALVQFSHNCPESQVDPGMQNLGGGRKPV